MMGQDNFLKYNFLELSPRIWSVAHLKKMAAIQASLYHHIQRDGINLGEYYNE